LFNPVPIYDSSLRLCGVDFVVLDDREKQVTVPYCEFNF
jgi:hypothetical protein